MKKNILLAVLVLTAGNLFAQVTHVVQADGFDYSPSNITINVGDSVRFDVGPTHPTRQVSQSTWDNNGTTLLEGGFDFAAGDGTVGFPDAGTFYYVCTAHISQGMKGRITVQDATPVVDRTTDGFEIYPVPLDNNELNVVLQSSALPVHAAVYDLTGSLRINKHATAVDGILKIDCSSLPSGVYLLKINAGGQTMEKKFLKY